MDTYSIQFRGLAPLTVNFDGTGSFDPEGSELVYAWNFNDGSELDTTSAPTHTFEFAGSYTVLLTVGDDRNQSETDTIDITVTEPCVGGDFDGDGGVDGSDLKSYKMDSQGIGLDVFSMNFGLIHCPDI